MLRSSPLFAGFALVAATMAAGCPTVPCSEGGFTSLSQGGCTTPRAAEGDCPDGQVRLLDGTCVSPSVDGNGEDTRQPTGNGPGANTDFELGPIGGVTVDTGVYSGGWDSADGGDSDFDTDGWDIDTYRGETDTDFFGDSDDSAIVIDTDEPTETDTDEWVDTEEPWETDTDEWVDTEEPWETDTDEWVDTEEPWETDTDIWVDTEDTDLFGDSDTDTAVLSTTTCSADILIATGQYGYEIGWSLVEDSTSATIASDNTGLYSDNSSYTQSVTLVDGEDYTFNMTDSYGDGWNGGTFTITSAGGTVQSNGTLATGSVGAAFFTFSCP